MNVKTVKEIKSNYRVVPVKRIRVCVYARVSRVNEYTEHSLAAQKEYYTRIYKYNPEYELIDVVGDLGISGSKESRPGFDRMLELARNKEIDLVVTKSISRFARNVVLLISVIRELKELGIAIYFEKEKINTMKMEGEMLLSIYGSVAEEERKQVSTNIKWAYKKCCLKGNPPINFSKTFGYDKGFVINEPQAEIVRYVYKRYLEGASAKLIARELRDKKAPYFYGKDWSGQRVLRMIMNEIYCGDLLMQKTFKDYRGKQMKNRGEVPKYLIENHHEPIVSKEIWNEAQRIQKGRLNMYGRSNK